MMQRKEFTVFVSNIPQTLDRYGLRGIFQKAGRITDTFIPFRRSKITKARFGFVRFWRQRDASRCVEIFNNAIIRGSRISVNKARFEKSRGDGKVKPFKSNRSTLNAPKSFRVMKLSSQEELKAAQKSRLSQEGPLNSFTIQGEVNPEFVDWLMRSLVCKSEEPRDLGALTSALASGFGECTKVCSLSSHKFILTLPSVVRMEELLCNHEELGQWFSEVKKWDKSDFCESRKVCLEIFGVPPHGWTWENFHNIANIWGRMISLGKSILRTDSFVSMKVLIDTAIFNTIEGDLILTLEDAGYRVKVKEAGSVVQLCQSPKDSTPSFPSQTSGVNGVADAGVNLEDGVVDSGKLSGHLMGMEGKEVPQFQNHSNPIHEDERALDFQNVNGGSSVRTKTALFNHVMDSVEATNGYSTSLEVQKSSIQGGSNGQQARGLEIINSENTVITTPVPNVQMTVEEEMFHEKQGSEDLSQPPGFERSPQAIPGNQKARDKIGGEDYSEETMKINKVLHRKIQVIQGEGFEGEESQRKISHGLTESDSVPPGFEGQEVKKGGVVKKGKVKNRKGNLGEDRRVTRSQLRKGTTQTGGLRTRETRQFHGRRQSTETTESIKQTAEEALHFGELVGVKVISHRENAIKRITDSLKANRAQRAERN